MENIARRQNEQKALLIQFASRKLFNRAEKINYWIWALFIPSACAAFFTHGIIAIGVSVFVLIATIAISFLKAWMKKTIHNAADLRNMFDRHVFGLAELHSDDRKNELLEIAHVLSERYPDEYRCQVSNNGSVAYPGVKDWYNTNVSVADHCNPTICLIKENTWWDKKMFLPTLISYHVIVIFLIVSLFFIFHQKQAGEIVAASLGILNVVLHLGERIAVVCKYIKVSWQLDGFVKNIDAFIPERGLLVLQEAIENRRHIPLVHSSLLHKTNAKKLHERYKKIFSIKQEF